MKGGDLSSRLSALKKAKEDNKCRLTDHGGKVLKVPAGLKTSRNKSSSKKKDILGWERTAPMVLKKITVLKDESPPVPAVELKKIYGIDENRELFFFDLETTGLSGGAGNLAFLAGVGRYISGEFRLVQLFLEDYPGEREFLLELQKELPADAVWVSYNGKAFDSNLLKTRLLLNGETPVIGENLDLLYPARRLWKGLLEDCSLGTVEREVLHKERGLDIPGRMIPDIWFGYLRSGNPERLDSVFAHHCEDITSLLLLYNSIGKIFAGDSDLSGIAVNKTGLGSLLLKADKEAGIRVLRRGLSEGDQRCGLYLGYLLKKSGKRQDALEIWELLWDEWKNPSAGVELAKELEHGRGDYEGALEIVEELLTGPVETDEKLRMELEHRKKRLIGHI